MIFAALALAKDELHLAVVPAMAYDPDDGFGLGARIVLDQYAPGYEPYRVEWIAQGFASVNGYHHHRVKFDATGLGPAHDLRLWGHFAYRQWQNDGYWGVGNGTVVERAYVDVEADSPERKRYRYTLIQPFGRLTLRWYATPHFGPFAFVAGRWTKVETYAGSLVEEEQPFGMDGGFGLQLGLGVIHDTREPEITPDAGHLFELALRYHPQLPASDGHFFGVYGAARGFVPFGSGVVLGSRIAVDWLYGDIPFYDLITWGGFTPTVGFGGSETLRGNSFGRWRAPGKAVWNSELRADVWRHRIFRRELRWQLVPFFDAGMVFGAGEEAPDFPIHPTAGLGLHPIFDQSVAGRFDFGTGIELVREADGSMSYEPDWGFYVVFDHMF